MGEKIDYDKYLQELGDFETDQQKVIQKYLEEQCKRDEALNALYRPEKLQDCYNFIKEVARKKAVAGCACLDESTTYKIARDYFIEILPRIAETPPEVSAAVKTDAMPEQENRGEKEEVLKVDSISMPQNVVEDMKKDVKENPSKVSKYGFEIFEDEGEDEIVQTIVEGDCITVTGRPKTETEKTVEGVIIKYDEDGNGLLPF